MCSNNCRTKNKLPEAQWKWAEQLISYDNLKFNYDMIIATVSSHDAVGKKAVIVR